MFSGLKQVISNAGTDISILLELKRPHLYSVVFH